MKKNSFLVMMVLLAGVIFLTSCGASTGAIETEEGGDALQKTLSKHFKSDDQIFVIIFSTTELKQTVSQVTVGQLNLENSNQLIQTIIPLPNGDITTEEASIENFDMGGISTEEYPQYVGKFQDLDFAYIREIIQKAKGLIVEMDAEVPKEERVSYVATSLMKVYFADKKENMEYFFTMQYIPETGKTERVGKTIYTNYYEFRFYADAAGNVEYYYEDEE